jgi:hypothetical protein
MIEMGTAHRGGHASTLRLGTWDVLESNDRQQGVRRG